jgi:hypothetical protein
MFLKHARQLIGGVLVTMGILWLAFSSIAMVGLGNLYAGRDETLSENISRFGIVGPFVTGCVAVLSGILLTEGKKRTVLFLRPFRSGVNDDMMRLFTKKVGRSFTIIALNDGHLSSPRNSIRDKLLAVFIIVPSSVILLFVSAFTMPIAGEPSTLMSTLPSLAAGALGVTLIVDGWMRFLRPRRDPNRMEISTERSLVSALSKVRHLSIWRLRWIMSRSLILATSNEMWQPAVYKIGLLVDAVSIDISRSSPNIEWEL